MKLIRIQQAAKRAGFTLGTMRQYVARGTGPKPRERVGTIMLFGRRDVDTWARKHKGRPGARKSAHPRKRHKPAPLGSFGRVGT